MKKLLFLPLLVLVLLSSCSKDDSDDNGPELTETEQQLVGNWKMHTIKEEYYNDNDEVMHNFFQDGLNNLFEYNRDGSFRFKGEEDANWSSGRFVIQETDNEKKFIVLPPSGNVAEATVMYTIEKLTATEMVLVDAYDYASFRDANGNEVISRRVVKTYMYEKM